MTESQIQDAILLALGSRPDIRLHRQQAGRVAVVPWDKVDLIRARTGVSARTMQLAPPGAPDLCGVLRAPCAACGAPTGRALHVEVKTPVGRLSPAQHNFHRIYRDLGAVVLVARSPEDALAQLAPLASPPCPTTKSPSSSPRLPRP